MIVDDMISFIRKDLIIFGIGVFVFLVLMLTIIFREVRWVMLPLASCAFARAQHAWTAWSAELEGNHYFF